MTPRSRKPVIIGAMLGMAAENYHNNLLNYVKNDENDLNDANNDADNIANYLNSSIHKSKSESDLIDAIGISTTPLLDPIEAKIFKLTNSQSDESLSTPFR